MLRVCQLFIKVLENIYSNPVCHLAEKSRFLLERTISGVDHHDKALKDRIVALYPYYIQLPGLDQRLASLRISQNSHVNKPFWQQFLNYAPPSLRVIRVTKGQRANVIYVRTIIYRDSRLNRPESVSLASLARQLAGNFGYVWVQ